MPFDRIVKMAEVKWAHAIGWQLAIPSNAEDAVGLLRTALRANNPTIFFEHRAMLDDPSLGMQLYGDQPLQVRFEQFASMLYKISAAKWPIATYFLFLSDPGAQVFVKPEVTKSAAEVLGIDINYKPELNWLTYSQVLRLAEAIRLKLIKEGQADLIPRDMVDVQSFIWVTAPSYC